MTSSSLVLLCLTGFVGCLRGTRRSRRVRELVSECEELKTIQGASPLQGLSEAELEERVQQRREEIEKKNGNLRALLQQCYQLTGDVKLMQAGRLPQSGPAEAIRK